MCAAVCPTGALFFGSLEELLRGPSERDRDRHLSCSASRRSGRARRSSCPATTPIRPCPEASSRRGPGDAERAGTPTARRPARADHRRRADRTRATTCGSWSRSPAVSSLGAVAVAVGLFPRRTGSATGACGSRATSRPGASVQFTYPGADDRAIAMRLPDGTLVAYSSICTHLSCAVLLEGSARRARVPVPRRPVRRHDRRVLDGPPPRPLPVIDLEERADGIYAIGAGPDERETPRLRVVRAPGPGPGAGSLATPQRVAVIGGPDRVVATIVVGQLWALDGRAQRLLRRARWRWCGGCSGSRCCRSRSRRRSGSMATGER